MKVVITSSFPLRGKTQTYYSSFPVYSDEIERTMSRELEFLNQYEDFSLELKIAKNSS